MLDGICLCLIYVCGTIVFLGAAVGIEWALGAMVARLRRRMDARHRLGRFAVARRLFLWVAVLLLCGMLGRPGSAAAWEFGEDWNTQDTILQTVHYGFLIADWRYTLKIPRSDGKYREYFGILDKDPSLGDVNRYFLAAAILNPLVAAALPSEVILFGFEVHPRTIWQSIGIGINGGCVAINVNLMN